MRHREMTCRTGASPARPAAAGGRLKAGLLAVGKLALGLRLGAAALGCMIGGGGQNAGDLTAKAQTTSRDPAGGSSLARPSGAPGGVRLEVPKLLLSAPASEIALDIVLHNVAKLPPNSFVRIHGLSPKMALSDGYSIAPGSWAVPLAAVAKLRVIVPAGVSGRNDVAITVLAIDGGVVAKAQMTLVVAPTAIAEGAKRASPPSGFNGLGYRPKLPPPPEPPANRAETITPAPRLPTRLAAPIDPPAAGAAGPAVPTDGANRTASPAARPPAVASLPPPGVAPVPPASLGEGRRLTPDAEARARGLLARGRTLITEGNIVLARLFFQRSADIGLADGALAMGETFDEAELVRLGAVGVQPDRNSARVWYEKARSLGAGQPAIQRLERLERLGGR